MKNKLIYKGAGICILTFILMILGTVNVEASETYYCSGCRICEDTIERRYGGSWSDACQETYDRAWDTDGESLPYSCGDDYVRKDGYNVGYVFTGWGIKTS